MIKPHMLTIKNLLLKPILDWNLLKLERLEWNHIILIWEHMMLMEKDMIFKKYKDA